VLLFVFAVILIRQKLSSRHINPFIRYCSRLAQTVTDFADASHSESAKSTTTTVLYGIFSSENSYPCTVIFIPSLDHLEYTMDLIYNQIYNIDIFH